MIKDKLKLIQELRKIKSEVTALGAEHIKSLSLPISMSDMIEEMDYFASIERSFEEQIKKITKSP